MNFLTISLLLIEVWIKIWRILIASSLLLSVFVAVYPLPSLISLPPSLSLSSSPSLRRYGGGVGNGAWAVVEEGEERGHRGALLTPSSPTSNAAVSVEREERGKGEGEGIK